MFDLNTLVRPNIRGLKPYRCARDDFTEGILLDANENTMGPALASVSTAENDMELNRYPDPHQLPLKDQICAIRNARPFTGIDSQPLTAANVCLGVGSDESIDLLMRCVCTPATDKILICPPTYGMYSICANINDVGVVKVPLTVPDFQVDSDAVANAAALVPSIKLIYLTSPGNPTGTLINASVIVELAQRLAREWNGLVVVDEAYIDFAEHDPSSTTSSVSTLVNALPNLVVLQTLSKAFGLAGVRLGVTFSLPQLSSYLNAMKYPYNISSMASSLALRATHPETGLQTMRGFVDTIVSERSKLLEALRGIAGVGKLIGGLDANFVLVEILNKQGEPCNDAAHKVYTALAVDNQVVVRFRGSEPNCNGCLRISIGTLAENDILVQKLIKCLQ